MKKTEWTICAWDDRAEEGTTYVPIDRNIDNIVIDAFGRKSGTAGYNCGIPRRTVLVDDGSNPAYCAYDTPEEEGGEVVVIRVTEFTEEAEA